MGIASVLNALMKFLVNQKSQTLTNNYKYVESNDGEMQILKNILNFYLFFKFLAALDLCCCALTFSGCTERGGPLSIVLCRLLTAVAPLVMGHRL